MKKLILVFVIGAAIVWFGADLIKKNTVKDKKSGGRGAANVVVAIETGNAKTGEMLDEGIFSGSIEPESKFQVAPKTSGRIKKINFDIGDTINKGDVVAELDDEELVLAVEQAESALEIAKANYNESGELLEISKREYARVQTMRKQKVSSEVEVENASADYKTRQAKHLVNKSQLRQSETSLAQAKLKLDYTKVDASWTVGANTRFVAERFLNEGAMVTANTPIISVIDIATLTAVIDVVERDYFKIYKDMDALIIPTAIPGKTCKAKVSRIAPMLDEVSRQARIELVKEDGDGSIYLADYANIIRNRPDSSDELTDTANLAKNKNYFELVTTHSCNKLAVIYSLFYALGNLNNRTVTGIVAMSIVNRLKVIHIDGNDCKLLDHLAFFIDFADSDICNLHIHASEYCDKSA